MLPAFTEVGLLPVGIHRATFEEFETRFVYFDRSDRRFRIFEKLRILYQESQRSGIVKRFLVGGSFVTAKAEPNDFDCILVFERTVIDRELLPMEYNLIARQRARRTYGGDVISVVEDSITYHEFLGHFQKTRGQQPVGLVEIEL